MDSNTLLGYQPEYYKTSDVMKQINTANASELTILNNRVDLEYNNLYPDTADSNTLSRFEKDNGLDIIPSYDLEYRRTKIYSRMVGQGGFSVTIIKSVAESFNNGKVNVTLDLSNFQFTIKFISNVGIPSNMSDLEQAIEDIKPPYLQVNYTYSYLLVNDVNSMTINNLNNTLLNKFAMGGN